MTLELIPFFLVASGALISCGPMFALGYYMAKKELGHEMQHNINQRKRMKEVLNGKRK